MKRLLTYLFILLGLGLTFSVNVKANLSVYEPNKVKDNTWRKNLAVKGTATKKNEDIICLIKRINSDTYSYFYVDKSEIYKLKNSKYNWDKILGPTNVKYPLTTEEKKELKFCDFKIYKSKNYDSFFSLKKQWENTGGFKGLNKITNKILSQFVDKNLYAEIIKDNNTQITKAEPSETQKVTNGKEIKNGFITNSYWSDDKKTKPIILATYYENDCPLYGSISYIRPKTEIVSQRITGLYSDCNMFSPNSKLARIYFDEKGNVSSVSLDKKDVTHIYGKQKYIGLDIQNTENNNGIIVKGILKDYPAEKSSLNLNDIIIRINNFQVNSMKNFIKLVQEASTNQKIRIDYVPSDKITDKFDYNVSDIKTTYIIPKNENTITTTTLRLIYFPKQKKYIETIYKHFSSGGRESILPDEVFLKENTKEWQERQDLLKKDFNTLYKYYLSIAELKTDKLPELDFDQFYVLSNKTQIAKQETTIKSKNKVVKKPKQEEFKPVKKDIDNDAPVIEIAEAITVDSQAYTLKGKVKDKSQIYLTINERQVEVKKGKFELDRFSIDPDVAEELKIVAIDQWNNKSEKIVKVTIDLQSTDITKVYEELKPNNVKVKTDKNKIAIIIGIEKYENLTNLDAKYANRDAKAFRTYATRALGIKPSNIKVLIDDKANRGNTLEAFKIWLPKIAGKGGKDIHIFFAGHGLASENGKDLYILPHDGNAKLLDDTAITRLELISLIQKVNPKSVTMFFDTCYSGQTRDERMLVASLLRPIQIISEEQDTPDNFTIFSASNYDQVSGGIEEAQHGMFSYYLMKGLEGKADENKDRKITNGELIAYLKDNVSEEAFTQNREQDPMLAGDPDKVLISYQ